MLKINTPSDIIFNEIKKDDFLLSIINNINGKLSELEQFPNNGVVYHIVVEDILTIRQKNLLKYIFNMYGWNLDILFVKNIEEKEKLYKFYIVEQNKIYLN